MNTTCLLVSSPFLFVVQWWVVLSGVINLALTVIIMCLLVQRRKNSRARVLLVRWRYRVTHLRERPSHPRIANEVTPEFFAAGRARIAADMEHLLERDAHLHPKPASRQRHSRNESRIPIGVGGEV